MSPTRRLFDRIEKGGQKMNIEELEINLRESTAAYVFKITLLIYGVQQNPCPNCPFKNEDPPVSLLLKDQKCFERCPYNIAVWILNTEQEILYQRLRPDDKKRSDLEMAINAHKTALVEQMMGRVPQAAPLPLF